MDRRVQIGVAACILIVSTLALRGPWLDHAIWSLDEGSTHTMGQQVLEGDILYRDAADNRSPLVPFIKAAIFAIFGDWNAEAVHTILAILLGFAALLIGLIARKMENAVSGLISAGTFVLLQFFYIFPSDSMSANTEWFVVIFSVAAFAGFIASLERPTLLKAYPIGILFGMSVLCKQPGLLDFVVASVLTGFLMLNQPGHFKKWLKFWLGMAAGLSSVLVAALVYFAAHDALGDYIYYAATFNTEIYIPEIPFTQRLLAVRVPFLLAWNHVPAVGLLAVGGAMALGSMVIRHARQAPPHFPIFPWLILGWTFSGLISTTLSGREFAHYSEQVIPGLSLAVGWSVSQILNWRPKFSPAFGRWAGSMTLLLIVVMAGIRYPRIADELDGAIQHEMAIGSEISRHTNPDDRIFVWGYVPELYFHAQRLPATRFIYTNYITGMVAWSNIDALKETDYAITPDGWTHFDEDYQASPPEVIVDTGFARNYVKFPLSERDTLWSDVKLNFAEIALEKGRRAGMRVFRRLLPRTEDLDSPSTDSSQSLSLRPIENPVENEPTRIEVQGPPGFNRIDLLINDAVVSSLPYPSARPVGVRFFVPGDPYNAQRLSVRASGPEGNAISPILDFAAFIRRQNANPPREPSLNIENQPIAPSIVSSSFLAIKPYELIPGTMELVAPARLVYNCPAGVKRITFIHGLAGSVVHMSDGYDIVVNWVTPEGSSEKIWQKRITPRKGGKFQITQTEDIALPARDAGQLEFRFYSGEISDTHNDNLFFGKLVGQTQGPSLTLGEDILPSINQQLAEDNEWLKNLQGDWIVHPPARIEWIRPSNLMSLTFDYGIDEAAYSPSSDGHSNGVEFKLELIPAEGDSIELWKQLLEPFNHPQHRGEQTTTVILPREPQGRLVFSTGPGYHDDHSWDWSYAGKFRGTAPGPPITLGNDRRLLSINTDGYEGGWADQFDETHWGAQSPQELTYPKPVDLTAVTFSFGLNDNAARDENGQRRSDGVEVVVIFEPEEGEPTELYRRFLDPFANPTDAGKQTARVLLPLGQSGKLKFQMNPGPYNSNAYDWAYWGPFSGETVTGSGSR